MGDGMVGTVMRRHHLQPSSPLHPFYIQDGWSKRGRAGKFDTLSGGSALSRSMRYAEGWLYSGEEGGGGGGGGRRRDAASLFGTVRGDPYDAVRRSRLGRAKSASPPRRKSILEPSPSPYDLLGEEEDGLQEGGYWTATNLLPRVAPPSRPPRRRTPAPPKPPPLPPPLPEIKSILKKPESPEMDFREKTRSAQKPPQTIGFRDYKHKKKKQVQFSVSGESKGKVTEKRSPLVIKKPPPEPPPRAETPKQEPKQHPAPKSEPKQHKSKDSEQSKETRAKTTAAAAKVEEPKPVLAAKEEPKQVVPKYESREELKQVPKQERKEEIRLVLPKQEAREEVKLSVSPKEERKLSVTYKQEPKLTVSTWQEPKLSVTSTQEPKLSLSFKQEPRLSVTSTQEPKLSLSFKQEPKLSVSSRQEPKLSISPSQEPVHVGFIKTEAKEEPTRLPGVRQEPLGHEKESTDTGEDSRGSPSRSSLRLGRSQSERGGGLFRPRGPPPPPPRTVFPFTKSQIEEINRNRPASRTELVPTRILTLVDPGGRSGEEETYANTVCIEVPPPPLPPPPPPEDEETNRTVVRVSDQPSSTTSILIGPTQPPLSTTSVVIGETVDNKVTININGGGGTEGYHQSRIRIVPEESLRTVLVVDQQDTELRNALRGEVEMRELVRRQIDPAEAARARLVPHICGRRNDDLEEEEEDEDPYLLLSSSSDSKSLSSTYDHQEKDKLEDEVEVDLGTLDPDVEDNGYETIRDPIYEEIADQKPPPLPLSPPPSIIDQEVRVDELIPTKSIFEGATKHDILSYLAGAKMRGIVASLEEDLPPQSQNRLLDMSSRISHLSNASDSSEDSSLALPPVDMSTLLSEKMRKSSAEVERNDSGVGSETSRSRWQHLSTEDQHHACEDCDQLVDTHITNRIPEDGSRFVEAAETSKSKCHEDGVMFAPLVCRKCSKRRTERREIITEIVETEEKYGRDLRILLEEFYRPMLVAGLLTQEQLSAIFLNAEELLEHNGILAERLRDALEIAFEQGDEDLLTVNVGSQFLETSPMLHAFESYCTRQGAASLLLANLEKEKELLRIFLRVSQMENSVLRRMNLNSFLMVPVQRVTKYPLLLSRLYKVTPPHIVGKEAIKEALQNIELHLEHINYLTKDISATKLWRRISIMNGRRCSSENDMITIKLRKIAVDVLEWNHEEVRFSFEGRLLYTQLTDNNWRRRGTIKLAPVNAILVTLGKPNENYQPDCEEELFFPRQNGIREASLILIREKGGRYSLAREPMCLDRCIVCTEADMEDYFEIQEVPAKETYIFKAEDGDATKRWYRQLQYHIQGLGAWRKRRNAFANIMMNGMQLRT